MRCRTQQETHHRMHCKLRKELAFSLWVTGRLGASQLAPVVKNLPVNASSGDIEMPVRSLSQEDPLKKEWQPTPLFFPEESYGQRSLVGYSS